LLKPAMCAAKGINQDPMNQNETTQRSITCITKYFAQLLSSLSIFN
jgi:hypothetical protein